MMNDLTEKYVQMRTESKNIGVQELQEPHTTIDILDIPEKDKLLSDSMEMLVSKHSKIKELIIQFDLKIKELIELYYKINDTAMKSKQRNIKANIDVQIEKIDGDVSNIRKEFLSFKNITIKNKLNELKNDITKREQENTEYSLVLKSGKIKNKIGDKLKQQINENIDTIDKNVVSINKLNEYLKFEDNMYISLVDQYVKINNEYKTVQENMQKNHKEFIKSCIGMYKSNIKRKDINICVEKIYSGDTEQINNLLSDQLLNDQELKNILGQLESRKNDFLKLEATLKTLFELFKEVSSMVNSQGVLIENISLNVETTYKHTHSARKYIIEAKNYNDLAKKKKICILMTVFFIIITLLIVGLVITNTVFKLI